MPAMPPRIVTAIAALTLTVLALLTVVPPPTAAPADTGFTAATFEKRLIWRINQARVAHGVHRVRFESCTDQAAETWARHLARTGRFEHQALPICGAAYSGEVLAKGAVTPYRTVQLWLDSPGHRQVILSAKPRRIGTAAVAADAAWVIAADFTRF